MSLDAFLFLAIKCQKERPNPMELKETEMGETL
jgi:hypothetical protein